MASPQMILFVESSFCMVSRYFLAGRYGFLIEIIFVFC
jgi:hypothetical protein